MEHLTESDAHVAETRCRREKVLPTTRRVARQNLLNEARKGEISCISEMAKLTALHTIRPGVSLQARRKTCV